MTLVAEGGEELPRASTAAVLLELASVVSQSVIGKGKFGQLLMSTYGTLLFSD